MTDQLKEESISTRLTFARPSDLKKVLKRLDEDTIGVIDFLGTIMRNEKVEDKLRLDAAKYLIDKRIQVSEAISRDQLTRTMGEAKIFFMEQQSKAAIKGPKDITPSDDEDSQEAVFNPEMVLDVSKIKAV